MVEYITEYHLHYGHKEDFDLCYERVFDDRDEALSVARKRAQVNGCRGFVTVKSGWVIDGVSAIVDVRTIWAFGF